MEETRWKEKIKPLDENAMEEARAHWMTVGKPLFSLGSLEDAVIQIAGIKGTSDFELRKRGLIIMCADNGVVEEGVTQTGQEVTAIVADNFTRGETSVCIMAEEAKVDLFPVDVGMATDVPSVTKKKYKVMYGTHNFAKEAAMTREEAVEAIEVGIQMVKKCAEAGYEILATGEMGIGNTTTSSAVASVLLREDPKVMTGKGAGLTKKGLRKKVQVIREAVERMQPDKTDAIDVLSKVGALLPYICEPRFCPLYTSCSGDLTFQSTNLPNDHSISQFRRNCYFFRLNFVILSTRLSFRFMKITVIFTSIFL